MEMYTLAVWVLGLAASCLAYPSMIYFTDEGTHNLAYCHPTKPCRTLVRETEMNQVYESQPMCQCPSGESCPFQWSDAPERSITRFLRASNKQLTLQMKFCDTVAPQRTCQPGEVALHIKGFSLIPQEVVAYNCSCPANEPLFLQRSWTQRNTYQRHQTFVCNMSPCGNDPDRPCMFKDAFWPTSRRYEMTYLCQCPEGKECKTDGEVLHQISLGYCRP